MSQTIILKRSAVSGKVPTTSSLSIGELAINTYDGKIFLNQSSSTQQAIQEVIITNTTNTGSINLIGNQNITGSVGVSGNLTVLGTINAQQFNIGIISSSVIYQSGSTKFGDTYDDIMQVTGSLQVSGSQRVTGSVNITGSLFLNGIAVSTGSSGTTPGPNTFDFNLDPNAAGTVNFIQDSTGNTFGIAQTGSFDVKINNTTYLSVSASAMNVTTGSITANYMHLAKYINNAGDLDFNI